MVALMEDKRDAVGALSRKHGVVSLFVLGSAARDHFRPVERDVDLLVDFGSMHGHAKVTRSWLTWQRRAPCPISSRAELIVHDNGIR
ncbi:MAG: hypothetical protein M1565_07870 [Actinobacteria bacterium]|nr:hypothetical protein [Actinomycetota bacterium]